MDPTSIITECLSDKWDFGHKILSIYYDEKGAYVL